MITKKRYVITLIICICFITGAFFRLAYSSYNNAEVFYKTYAKQYMESLYLAAERDAWKESFDTIKDNSREWGNIVSSVYGTDPTELVLYLGKLMNTFKDCNPFHDMFYISDRYGDGVLNHKYRIHKGIDLVPSHSKVIYPLAEGIIVDYGWDDIYGKWILINHGNDIETFYAHLDTIYYQKGGFVKGTHVTIKDKIGIAGTTGMVYSDNGKSGLHIHLEIRVNGNTINPEIFLVRPVDYMARYTSYRKEG